MMTEGRIRRLIGGVTAVVLAVAFAPATLGAQYFGRNKVQYRTFSFQILHTDHFDLYYYPEEQEAAAIAARLAERWHARLSRFFGHDLRGRQPIILYAAGAHFRQTNAIEGLIGEGTGGVTEALKRRVVLPMSGSLADTDHVLGHELVHAFQFDLTGADPREGATEAPGILAYPLWFVEGMAEYLSLGPVDAQTAMWMRDAALHEKLPHIRDLDDYHYFPYRWGHAFWAFIGARYGDRTVASLIRSAANPKFDLVGLARQLGSDPDTLTQEWHDAIRASAKIAADTMSPVASEPKLLISEGSGGGRYNVGPRVSPDGHSFAFFSERDRFSVEMFLADADTGKVRHKLIKAAIDPHFDSLEFLNSAGAWSPDGRTIALAAIRGGKPVVALIDPNSGDVRRELPLPGLDDVVNPTFSPDGQSVVLSGNAGGLLDLYVVSLKTGAIDRLTHDAFADLEPTFTPDGKSIVFVTERFSTDLSTLEPGPLRLARLNLETKDVRLIPAFLQGKHLSPQVSSDGRMITFIAEPDGVSNLYRIPIDGGPVERLTSVPTGIAGITTSSPALSQSVNGRLVFSLFDDGGHAVFRLDPADIVSEVAPEANRQAAVLPGRTSASGDVARLLSDYGRGLPAAGTAAPSQKYKQKLALDAIGQPVVSAGVSSYGAYVAGGISAYFSDMLGDRSLGVAGSINGSTADIGGQLIYVNRQHRWNWATSVEQIPYRVGYLNLTRNPADNTIRLTETIERETSRGATFRTAYPFSGSTRFEIAGGARALSFAREIRTNVYDGDSEILLSREKSSGQLYDPLYLGEASAAIVRDSAYFGATAPLYGARSRFEVGQSLGSLTYHTVLADWRRYYMPKRPYTIAARLMTYGRYGRDGEDPQLVDLYVGYPEFVHGYGDGSFGASECLRTGEGPECRVFDNLLGSRMLVGNVELRAPLRGLFTGDLEYGRIPIDVAAFADVGLMWTSTDHPAFWDGSRTAVRSVGGAIRVNVFSLLAVELSASHPFDRIDRGIKWQFGIRQGF